MTFDGFISYSHAADGRLAPAVQRGLHRLAKPWHRRRALWIFRDQTGLAVTPTLWTSIQQALDGSEYFVLLASPEAAASPWVNREIEHWVATKPADRILPVVTDGDWRWDPARGDFTEDSTAVPAALRGAFAEEPLYLDLRWARDDLHLSLQHGRFRDAIAQLAAPMHGISKDELEGEDVRQHRRARRLWSVAAGALTLLAFVAILTGLLAIRNADRANAAANEARRQAQLVVEQRDSAQRYAEQARQQEVLTKQQEARAKDAAQEVRRQEGLAREQQTLAARASTAAERQQANARYQRALADKAAARAREQKALADQQRGAAQRSAEQARRQETIARDQEQRAREAAEQARRQEQIARDQEKRAGKAAEETRRQQQIAITQRLVNQAQANMESDPRTALRLGLAAERVMPDAGTRGELTRLVASTHFAGELQGATDVAYSPSGVLALGLYGENVSLWNVTNRARPVKLGTAGKDEFTGSMTFSPDGRTLAFAERSKSVALWDVTKPARPVRLGALPDAHHVTFNPDGRTVASIGEAGRPSLWDMTDRSDLKPLATLPDTGRPSLTVAFSPDGRTMVTTGDQAMAWDVSNRADPVWRTTFREPLREAVAFSPVKPIVAAATGTGSVLLWDLADPAQPWPVGRVKANIEDVSALKFDRTGSVLAVAGVGSSVTLWSTPSRSGWYDAIRLHSTSGGGAYAAALSPDGKTLATAEGIGGTTLWNVAVRGAPEPAAGLPGHRNAILTMAYRPDGRSLVTVDQKATAIFWDVTHAARPVRRVTRHFSDDFVIAAALTRDVRTLAVMDGEGLVTLSNVANPQRPSTLGSFDTSATGRKSMMFSPDGRTIAVLKKGSLTLWDVTRRSRPARLGTLTDDSLAGDQLAFSPDGRTVAVTGRTVTLVDVRDRSAPAKRAELTGHTVWATSVAFSPDGRTVATGGNDKQLILWDVSVPARPYRLATSTNHIGWVGSVGFGPDGRTLAAGVGDHTVMLWDITDRAAPARFPAARRHDGPTGILVFNPKGRTLAAGGDANRHSSAAGLWDYSPLDELRADPVAHACAIAGRGLTAEEWRRYVPELPYRRSCGR
jgi:WD40 repeat protein